MKIMKVKDKKVIEVKKLTNKIVKELYGKNTKWIVTALTIGVLLYIFIRSISKQKV